MYTPAYILLGLWSLSGFESLLKYTPRRFYWGKMAAVSSLSPQVASIDISALWALFSGTEASGFTLWEMDTTALARGVCAAWHYKHWSAALGSESMQYHKLGAFWLERDEGVRRQCDWFFQIEACTQFTAGSFDCILWLWITLTFLARWAFLVPTSHLWLTVLHMPSILSIAVYWYSFHKQRYGVTVGIR